MTPRRALVAGLALAAASAAPANAWTTPAAMPGAGGQQHIDYPPFDDGVHDAPWMVVGNVGDVNGDGREDVATGFQGFGGEVYVTFSTRLASAGQALGLDGFQIEARDFAGGLASAGDANGDGLGDVAVVRTGAVSVVFGRDDGQTVDAGNLGLDGFTIANAGGYVAGGFDGIILDAGVAPLGDVNGDGVPDLLVATAHGAAIVFPPPDPGGTTIDASVPGPHVATIAIDPAHAIDASWVDVLGDVDGDGRTDVMVGGEETQGTDQVVYGVATPPPGTTVTLPAAVAAGRAFAIRTHDGRDGWHGELEQARAVGDQNGDGIRDVGMLCGGCGTGGRQLRVVYTPAFGTTVDAGTLYASDARGWSFHSYADIVDVGDQNGDGVGDLGDRSYVYFPDPAHESGGDEPVSSGFYFEYGGEIAASLGDVNGDGRREIAVARPKIAPNDPNDSSKGEQATYALDIYDSATAPQVGLPGDPAPATGGGLVVGVDVGSGAGARGDGLPLHPKLELATMTGATTVAADPGTFAGSQHDLQLGLPTGGLRAGTSYRIRATATNGRGQEAAGPWRTFTYEPSPGGPPAAPPVRGTRAPALPRVPAIAFLRSPSRLHGARLALLLGCTAAAGRCHGTVRLRFGSHTVGAQRFGIAARHGRTVLVRVSRAGRRLLARARTLPATLAVTVAVGRGRPSRQSAALTLRA